MKTAPHAQCLCKSSTGPRGLARGRGSNKVRPLLPSPVWARTPTPFLKWPWEGSCGDRQMGWGQTDRGTWELRLGLGRGRVVLWPPPPSVPKELRLRGRRQAGEKGLPEVPGEQAFLPSPPPPPPLWSHCAGARKTRREGGRSLRVTQPRRCKV